MKPVHAAGESASRGLLDLGVPDVDGGSEGGRGLIQVEAPACRWEALDWVPSLGETVLAELDLPY